MKPAKRIFCLAMSAVLAASMGMPAIAAGELEKKETVYTILNPDGSLSSQSVSVHLHREGGLSGVADESSLSDIACTSGEGGFTQNGQTLTWNVEADDARYNGSTEKQAPVSAEITYCLDGTEAPLEELLGKSGRLSVSIHFTNHETATVTVNGQERQVCAPFFTMAAVVLDENATNIQAEHGRTESFNGRQAVGFLCLPGVKDSLDGLLSGTGLEDKLFDTVTVEADVKELTAPTIFVACATDPELLEDTALDELEKLEGLGDDMDAMEEAMTKLLDGAAQLAQGASELSTGAVKLQDGVIQLDNGAAKLRDGTAALQNGASALNSGSVSARDGANELKSGADQLAAGLGNLQSGAGALSSACQQLKTGSATLTAGLNTLNEQSAPLNNGASQVLEGSAALAESLSPEGTLGSGSQAFADALSSAAAQGSAAMQQLPSPEAFGQLLAGAGIDPEQQAPLLTAYTSAYQAAGGLSSGMDQLNAQYAQIQGGIQQAGQGAAALHQGAGALSQGTAEYTQGVVNAAAGANQLDSGLAQLGQQLPGLTGGVNELAAGANQLSVGAGSLRDGNAALADGAAQLAAGIDELAAGAGQLTEGIQALVRGAAELAEGASRLAEGSSELQDGLIRFDQEAISKLTSSVDPEQLEELNVTVESMKELLKSYQSFSGAAEGTQNSVKFIMKTRQPEQKAETEAVDEEYPTEESGSLWERIVGLFR